MGSLVVDFQKHAFETKRMCLSPSQRGKKCVCEREIERETERGKRDGESKERRKWEDRKQENITLRLSFHVVSHKVMLSVSSASLPVELLLQINDCYQ